MSAHVNLLPPELAQRSRAARTRGITIAAVVAWVAVLAVFYLLKLGAVAGVENERDLAQQEVDRLEAQVAELQPYADLDRQLAARNDLLAAAMATEVSWARLLNDVAIAFPGNASLLSFNAATGPGAAAAQQAEAEASDAEAGRLEFTGYSVQEFAPGVESVLQRLNDVRGIRDSYLSEGADEVREGTAVTSFAGAGDLDEEIFTRRYLEGLPPERSE